MGGYNSTECLREKCSTFQANGESCEFALEVHSSKVSEGPTTRRVCGEVLGPLASELSETEVIDLIIQDRIPLINDGTK